MIGGFLSEDLIVDKKMQGGGGGGGETGGIGAFAHACLLQQIIARKPSVLFDYVIKQCCAIYCTVYILTS